MVDSYNGVLCSYKHDAGQILTTYDVWIYVKFLCLIMTYSRTVLFWNVLIRLKAFSFSEIEYFYIVFINAFLGFVEFILALELR